MPRSVLVPDGVSILELRLIRLPMLDKRTIHESKVQVQIPAGIATKRHGCNMQQSENKR